MQQRKDEILAKKAKLAELKRQRELRQREFAQRAQGEGPSDVQCPKQYGSMLIDVIEHS